MQEVKQFKRKLRENGIQTLDLIYPSCNFMKIGANQVKIYLVPP